MRRPLYPSPAEPEDDLDRLLAGTDPDLEADDDPIVFPSFFTEAVPPSTKPDITTLRHIVSADALLSAEEVVLLLGGRQSVARKWLRQVPSMWHPSERRVYRWGDVLDHLRQQMREVA